MLSYLANLYNNYISNNYSEENNTTILDIKKNLKKTHTLTRTFYKPTKDELWYIIPKLKKTVTLHKQFYTPQLEEIILTHTKIILNNYNNTL